MPIGGNIKPELGNTPEFSCIQYDIEKQFSLDEELEFLMFEQITVPNGGYLFVDFINESGVDTAIRFWDGNNIVNSPNILSVINTAYYENDTGSDINIDVVLNGFGAFGGDAPLSSGNYSLNITANPDGRFGIIRYYTSSSMDFSDMVTRTPTNGYIEVIGNGDIQPTSNRSFVTKGEIVNYGDRKEYSYLFYECNNMTEMVVSATDKSKVTSFSSAWRGCSSLTSFPLLDTSKVTNFSNTWYGCQALTSFPSIQVDSGINLYRSWYNCVGLPSCPGLDGTVNIPAGADTTDMCYGI